jgi:hypothetical protein
MGKTCRGADSHAVAAADAQLISIGNGLRVISFGKGYDLRRADRSTYAVLVACVFVDFNQVHGFSSHILAVDGTVKSPISALRAISQNFTYG